MILKAFALLACAISLTACGADEQRTVSLEKQLTVTGSAAGLQRFVALQASRRPALTVSQTEMDSNGKATTVVFLPANFTGQELVQTTREALAAGLDYRYAEERRIAQRLS